MTNARGAGRGGMTGPQVLTKTSCSGCIAGVWSEPGIVEVSVYSNHAGPRGRLRAAWDALRGRAPEMLVFCQSGEMDRFRVALTMARQRAFGVEK